MAGRPTTKVKTKENEDLVDLSPRPHQAEYIHDKNVQRGLERLERHPAKGYLGLPAKSGRGGKYTWEGPEGPDEELDFPAAIDERDPNYVDETQEEVDNALVVGVVDVPKALAAPQGVARVEVLLKTDNAQAS